MARSQSSFPGVPDVICARMARIRKRDTKPELLVRRCAHRLGYRFRLHRADLPGTPDLIFPRLRKVILVHGCFWHQHNCASGSKAPRTRQDYWLPKFARNVARDHAAIEDLTSQGWQVLVIWECEVKNDSILSERVKGFLDQRQVVNLALDNVEWLGQAAQKLNTIQEAP